jgi:polysaccharide biosynthesis/export protein
MPFLDCGSSLRARQMALVLLVVCSMPAVAAQEQLTITLGDAVAITVVDQPELTNTYIAAGIDGGITVPLLGRLAVAGQTLEQVTAELQRRLLQYVRNPDVRVEIVHVRRVFVFGEVNATGEYPLGESTTLLEVLTRAGYVGTPEVLVIRSKSGRGPTPVDDPSAEIIRVNLLQLEKDTTAGRLSRNVVLHEGDSIYVSKDAPDRVYVSGEVDHPGAYVILEGTTVLQALTLAGGATERASLPGMRIVRIEGEDQRSFDAKLDARLQPGDILNVPRTYAMPWPTFGRPDLQDRQVHAIRLGPLSFVPTAAVTRIGIDSNIFNAETQPTSDFVVSAGPALDMVYDVKPVRASVTGILDFVYFEHNESQRFVNRTGGASVEVTPNRRMRFRVSGLTAITNDRPDPEVDARVPRIDQSVEGSVLVRPFQRVSLEVGARNFDRWFTTPFVYLGTDLTQTLTERVQSANVTTRVILTPFTTIVGSAAISTHRFDRDHRRDADANEVLVGAEWRSGGVLSGDARVGYMQYLSLTTGNPDLNGPIGDVDVFYSPFARTRFGFKVSRSTGETYHEQFAFAVIDRLGGSVQQGFLRRYDILLESYLERYGYESADFVSGHPGMAYETSFRHAGDVGVRFGPVRLGVNVSYLQRYTDFLSGRNYNAFRVMANLTYGVMQVRADQ